MRCHMAQDLGAAARCGQNGMGGEMCSPCSEAPAVSQSIFTPTGRGTGPATDQALHAHGWHACRQANTTDSA